MRLLIPILLLLSLQAVAQPKKYYISNTGNDANNGLTPATAWQTLSKINSFGSFVNFDSILFKSGEEFKGWLWPTHSQLKFGRYGGTAKATISGLTTITGFTNVGNKYYATNTVVKDSINVVVMDGYALMKGRTPNYGSYYYYSANTNTSLTSSSLTGTPNYTGADVIKYTASYFAEKGRITSQSTSTINYQAITALTPNGSSGSSLTTGDNNEAFFISGDSTTLDQQGEWYYRPSTSVLTIYSTSTLTGHTIEAPFVDTLVNISGLTGMSFNNLIFKGGNQFAILATSGTSDTVTNCNFYNSTNGIMVNNVSDIVVRNNTFNGMFQCAIAVQNRQRGGAIVMNNYIDSTGMWPGQGVFMYSRQLRHIIVELDSTRTQRPGWVSQNKAFYAGHAGVWWQGSNMYIDSNNVQYFNTQLQDNGGIYSWQKNSSPLGPGDKQYVNRNVNFNIIGNCNGLTNLETPATRPDVAGLYFDDQTQNVNANGNTVFNVKGIGVQLNETQNVLLRNTTLYADSIGILFNQKTGLQLINTRGFRTVAHNRNSGNNIHVKLIDQNANITTANYLLQWSSDSNAYNVHTNGYYNTSTTKVSGTTLPTGYTTFTNFRTMTAKEQASTTFSDSVRFIYNDSLFARSFALTGGWSDARTNIYYNTSITLQGMTSVILKYAGVYAPPVVIASADQTLLLPPGQTFITAHVSSTTSGGKLPYAYTWTKIGGPASNQIVSQTNSQTDINLLVVGVYQFKILVTDSTGTTGADTVQITINQQANNPPTANAGNDTTITLPANSANLNASLSTDDNGIQSYFWAKLSGPSGGTITNPNVVSTTVTALTQGTYLYSVTVTDIFGSQSTDTKQITVNPAIPPVNQPPVANAGGNSNITLPTNTAPLNGSGSTDPDGTIVSYRWDIISQPVGSNAVITNPNISITTLTVVLQGTYTVRIKVTDNNGDTGVASKTVIVNPEPIIPLVVNLTGTNILCFGASTGAISSSVSGGKTPYTYLWSNSATTSSISSLAAGGYSLRVTDANNSVLTTPITTLTQNSQIQVNASYGTISVPGGTTAVTVSAVGGVPPYTGTGNFTGQGIGNHTYIVTDANGCTGQITINIPLTPTPMSLSLTPTNPACAGFAGGILLATPSGGVAPYLYTWTTQNGTIPPGTVDTTTMLIDIPSGTYHLTVYDNNGDSIKSTSAIVDPPILQAYESHTTITNQGGTSQVTITKTGGTGSVTGTGTFTRTAGTWVFYITDSNGCTSSVTAIIPDGIAPPPVSAKKYKIRKAH